MQRSRLFLLGLLIAALVIIIKEQTIHRPDTVTLTTSDQVEMCLTCHTTEKLDKAHAPQVMGCSPCHLGDNMAIDKKKAHKGIVNNPGDLRHIEKTCGTEGCHSRDVKKVKNSLMATNRGILATLLYYWGEAPDQNGDFSVEKLIQSDNNSLAIDYFRKLCGTCHLWKQKGDLPGFFGKKGGGCSACHSVPVTPEDLFGEEQPENPKKTKPHPLIIKKVPSENCIRCHNRSGRIGLSYTGKFESEGYGTPYENGGPSSHQLPGNRFYLDMPPDVHHEKGMACIDCHTRNEIMGDGTSYAHYEDQLEISCTTCHGATPPGKTRKGNMLNNITSTDGIYELTGKLDDKKHPLVPFKQGTCDFDLHKRLSCEACHSTWVPQCYGCHVKRDLSETDRDKLTGKDTPGWWSEGRSFIRYERPMLGLWNNEVVVITPGCQDMVTLLNKEGQPQQQFNRLTMAAINPHTTQKQGRTCRDCHILTKTMGLGEGTAWYEDNSWHFSSIHQGEKTPPGITVPLDGYVAIDGTALQNSSRKTLRPFNKEELAGILRTGVCVLCHDSYATFKGYTQQSLCPNPKGMEKLRETGLVKGER